MGKQALKKEPDRTANHYKRHDFSFSPYHLRYIQARTLLDEGKTYSQINQATGLSSATIAKVSKREIELSPSWIKAAKRTESLKLTQLIHDVLDSITPDVIAKSSFLQRATGAAVLIDKRRLIDGESTHNVAHAGLIDTLDNDRAELMRRLQAIDGIVSL